MKKDFLKVLFLAIAIAISVSLSGEISAMAQSRNLTGLVVDEQGEPVVGAGVVIEGTLNGVMTDGDGRFVLENVPSEAVLSVSFLGFHTQLVNVANRSEIKVVMVEDAALLDEVVVVGYGVQRKSDITGAITSLDGEDLSSRSVESLQSALQGKAVGVMVLSSSAAPGSTPSVRIRGFSSNSSSASDPLYVVDGLKVSNIAYLDPTVIESMEILKDGASAAIYGAEAGNGVVLITTKNGTKGTTRVFYDFNYGFNSLARKAPLMNAEQYVAYQTASGNGTLMSNWDGKIDNDWFDTLYGDGGSFQRHSVGFEKGGDGGSFYTSLSYVNNDGMYYGDKDYMRRLTFQVNASYKIKPWLEFSTNNSIESSVYSNNEGVSNPNLCDPLTPAFYDKNNLPEYMLALINANGDEMFMKNEVGDYVAVPQYASDSTNPLTMYYSQNSKHQDVNVRGVAALNLTPFKGLTITSRIGYRFSATDYVYDGVPVYFSITPRTKLSYSAQNSMSKYYEWENFANFGKTFGKHHIEAMAGMSYRNSWYNYTKGSTDAFTNNADNFHYLSYSANGAIDSVTGESSVTRSIGYFGRLGYSYDDRYNLQVTFRADAYDASKLSKQSRWGYFPSVSAGWTISNENFMKGIDKDILSSLKVRASYGENGNVNVLNGYKYASSLGLSGYYPIDGGLINTISPSDVLANPGLRWENSVQTDFGMDARFLSNRMNLTIDYYNKNTSGQLVSMTSPLSSGTSTVVRNVGKVNNHGFEFELGWKDVIGDFSYDINANLSTLSNKVVSLGGNSRIEGADGFVYFDEGQPVWSFYGWDYTGVAKDGTAVYRDLDDNDVINDKDKLYLGSAIPDIQYGITVSMAYRNFDFTIFGSGMAGGELSLTTRSRPYANRPAVFWTECYDVKGAEAKYPHPDVNGDPHMYKSSSQLTDGSYFKIKQIQLGYNVPVSLLSKVRISKIRAFVSLENYFCFTKYQGMDPESVSASGSMGLDLGDYPTPKTLSLGLNVSF